MRVFRKRRQVMNETYQIPVCDEYYGVTGIRTPNQVLGELSETCSKVIELFTFENYLLTKLYVSSALEDYFEMEVFRKMRWHTYINTQRLEEKMVKRFQAKYGPPEKVIVCIGDYSQANLKFTEPVKGKHYRELFRKHGYEVYLVDEFRTSKKCHVCHHDLIKDFKGVSHRPKTYGEEIVVHGLLRCKTCQQGERLWNRDLNAVKNILAISESEIKGLGRPEYLCRTSN